MYDWLPKTNQNNVVNCGMLCFTFILKWTKYKKSNLLYYVRLWFVLEQNTFFSFKLTYHLLVSFLVFSWLPMRLGDWGISDSRHQVINAAIGNICYPLQWRIHTSETCSSSLSDLYIDFSHMAFNKLIEFAFVANQNMPRETLTVVTVLIV